MGVARVNEIALTNSCFTLQALTLKFNEELGLRSSNGVTNNVISICHIGNQTLFASSATTLEMLPLKLEGDLKGVLERATARLRAPVEA